MSLKIRVGFSYRKEGKTMITHPTFYGENLQEIINQCEQMKKDLVTQFYCQTDDVRYSLT